MSQRDVEVVQRIFDAFNSEDIELILAFTHPGFEVEVPPALSAEPAVYRGHDGMRRYWESFREVMDEIRFRAERLSDTPGGVLAVMRITARGRQTAIPVEQFVVGVWTICDGQVKRVRAYASLDEALGAAGLAG